MVTWRLLKRFVNFFLCEAKDLRSNSRGKTRLRFWLTGGRPPCTSILSYDGWNRRFLSSFEKLALT
jgi:hypothetical protein